MAKVVKNEAPVAFTDAKLQLREDMSPTFYELEKADDYLSDSLSTKMGKVSLSKISISKIKEE